MSTWSSVATAKQSQLDACEKVVVVTGYWPPTNEMLRPWSRNPKQNPSGWVGENWRNHGFNVYAFFPEFPPDADPMNDPFGSAGWVGSAESDLRVDFQDTSKDFWHIMDTYRPQILITTSRGGQIGWEIEAVEGGHQGAGNKINPALDWKSDQLDNNGNRNPFNVNSQPSPLRITIENALNNNDQSLQVFGLYLNGEMIAGMLAFVSNETFYYFVS